MRRVHRYFFVISSVKKAAKSWWTKIQEGLMLQYIRCRHCWWSQRKGTVLPFQILFTDVKTLFKDAVSVSCIQPIFTQNAADSWWQKQQRLQSSYKFDAEDDYNAYVEVLGWLFWLYLWLRRSLAGLQKVNGCRLGPSNDQRPERTAQSPIDDLL